jgi:hypothetical protein
MNMCLDEQVLTICGSNQLSNTAIACIHMQTRDFTTLGDCVMSSARPIILIGSIYVMRDKIMLN